MNKFIHPETVDKRWNIYSSIAIFMIAIFYLMPKIFNPPLGAVDFKYVWLAGRMWLEGHNPYGPGFYEQAQVVFEGGSTPQQWAYPPHFRPISQFAAIAPYETAAIFWRAFLALAVFGGTGLLIAAVRADGRFPASVAILVLAVSLTFSATAISISIGQSSSLVFFGYCLLIYGYLKNHKGAICLALIIIMLKPTYGVIPAFFLLAHSRYFKVIAIGALITLALSVWGLLGQGINETISGVSDAVGKYATQPVNLAPEMTGIRHVVFACGLGETSQFLYVLCGVIFAFGLGLLVQFGYSSNFNRIRSMVVLGLLVLLFAPLHTYDGYFALAVVVPALALSRLEAIACMPLLLLVWRSNNLATVTGFKLPDTQIFTGSTIEAVAATATFLLFAIMLLARANGIMGSGR
jgi:hypothetical protein